MNKLVTTIMINQQTDPKTVNLNHPKPWKFTYISTTNSYSDRHCPNNLEVSLDRYPLSSAKIGYWVAIDQIPKHISYLFQDLKLIPGQEVEIISRTVNGSVIIRIGEEQIGLGAEIANQILVIGIS